MKKDDVSDITKLRAELEEANDRILQLERALADKIIQEGMRKMDEDKGV